MSKRHYIGFTVSGGYVYRSGRTSSGRPRMMTKPRWLDLSLQRMDILKHFPSHLQIVIGIQAKKSRR